MKKIISTLLTVFLLTGTIFAEKKYSGDALFWEVCDDCRAAV